jgi:ATP-binding cassette subfamily F protein uup
VTSTLICEGDGAVREYVGGYDDWLRQSAAALPPVTVPAKQAKPRPITERLRKLAFKEERELELLPARIGELEGEQETLHRTLADPEFYRSAGGEVTRLNARLAEIEQELAEAYRRWEELEAIRG